MSPYGSKGREEDADDHSGRRRSGVGASPGLGPATIPEMLAEGFREEAEFYPCDGEPYVVFTMSDYAQNWSTEPVQEVHPFYPCLHGTKMARPTSVRS